VGPVDLEDLSWPHPDDNEDSFDSFVPRSEDHNRDEFQLINETGAGPGPQSTANWKATG